MLNCIKLHYAYNCKLNYNYASLHYTTLDYTTLHNTTIHHTSTIQLQIHYSNYTPHHNYNSTALELQLQLRCTTPHYIQQLWVRWPLQPLQQVQTKQNSNHLSVHQWIHSAIRSHNNQPLP